MLEEAAEILEYLCEESGVYAITDDGAKMFCYRYLALKFVWFVIDALILFLHVFLIIFVFKFEFNFAVRYALRWVLVMGIVGQYSLLRSVTPIARTQKSVNMFAKLCKHYPNDYIFKEDKNNG